MNFKPMISYAQQGGDVILRRYFDDKPKGFYIDVGAGYPSIHSFTKYFYDNGWHGINIEPQPPLFNFLAGNRPKDINLKVAVSTQRGKAGLTTFPKKWSWASLSSKAAKNHQNIATKILGVETLPLDEIITKYAKKQKIDFIKIDTEGTEGDVLHSLNLKKWQPEVLVIEATIPDTPVESHESWENYVLEASYSLAFFDGLDRYYASKKSLNDIKKLSIPPNIYDRFIPYRWWRLLSKKEQNKLIEKEQSQGRDVTNLLLYKKQVKSLKAELIDAFRRGGGYI